MPPHPRASSLSYRRRVDPRERFAATVEDYRRFRPDYPEALIDWIVERCELAAGSVVIDVGCGTGIASRQLAARGLAVVGADPNEAMLEAARAEGGQRLRWALTDAETLDVGLDRADAIVGGQCFHWIDLARARPRFAELVGPDGPVVAFWNLRDGSDPFMAGYEALLLEHAPEYAKVGAEPRAEAVAAAVDAERQQFDHAQVLDRAGFFGRVWSSSYVRHGLKDRDAFEASLDALFDRHAADGTVRFVYRTLALRFTPG